MNETDIKNSKIKNIFAILMLFVFGGLFVLLIVLAINQNSKLLMASIFSIIFVSIVFYVSKWLLNVKKSNL